MHFWRTVNQRSSQTPRSSCCGAHVKVRIHHNWTMTCCCCRTTLCNISLNRQGRVLTPFELISDAIMCLEITILRTETSHVTPELLDTGGHDDREYKRLGSRVARPQLRHCITRKHEGDEGDNSGNLWRSFLGDCAGLSRLYDICSSAYCIYTNARPPKLLISFRRHMELYLQVLCLCRI